ncbi:MAG: hypothetical protein U5N26_00115 [Candidatus Marinimicrobia bacterium]|nr:hypothetical protein [Candidatus Neomarinimicrobiota bacterium]
MKNILHIQLSELGFLKGATAVNEEISPAWRKKVNTSWRNYAFEENEQKNTDRSYHDHVDRVHRSFMW